MTLAIDDFGVPKNAMLFQVEENQLIRQRGMVIAHSKLKERKPGAKMPCVFGPVLEEAEKLLNSSGKELTVALVQDFVDPITGYTHLAAMSPVMVRSRKSEASNIGWILVAFEGDTK